MKNNLFIVFDGIDGSGKTTQWNLISNWISNDLRLPLVKFREPGGCFLAEKIRDLFLFNKMDPISQLLILSAARLENQTLLNKTDHMILCDRFIDSTYAYQGIFLEDRIIDYIVNLTVKRIPDIVFLFLNNYTYKAHNHFDSFAYKHRSSLIANFKKRIKDNYYIVPDLDINEQQNFIRNIIKSYLCEANKNK